MGFVVFVIIVIIAWAIYDKFFGGIAQLERGLNNTRKELFSSVRNSIDQAKNKYRNITNMEHCALPEKIDSKKLQKTE